MATLTIKISQLKQILGFKIKLYNIKNKLQLKG